LERKRTAVRRVLKSLGIWIMRKFTFIFVLIALVISGGPLLYASPTGPNPDTEKAPLNILLITVDTLRTDRVSCYSSKFLQTPHIDALSKDGTVFMNAYAHTSTTLPSHTNILLGTLPLYHGVHENTNFIVRPEFLTLAEYLKNYGYETGAFIGAFPLDSRFGLNQGFDRYDDDYDSRDYRTTERGERRGEIVVRSALSWLEKRQSPWFVWVHLYDPHDPYDPPEPYAKKFPKDLYSGEVSYVDDTIGSLIGFLDEQNLKNNTAILLTGDHGEGLEEHGEKTHGFFAYNSSIWIPLIIQVPGLISNKVYENVSHIDIFPTVCDIAGINKPDFLQGISLYASLDGKRLPQRQIYFESLSPYYSYGWAPITGYITQRIKYIESPVPELYNLENDPGELKNLAGKKNLEEHRTNLERLISSHSSDRSDRAEKKMDRKTLERLKSLGYISVSVGTVKKEFGPEDDVKYLLPYHNTCFEALKLAEEGKAQAGIERLKKVIRKDKNICIAYSHLATVHWDKGQRDDALEVLEKGLKKFPLSYDIFSGYISYLYEEERYQKVIQTIESQTLREMDYDAPMWNRIGLAYWNTGNTDKARGAYEKSIVLDPNFPIPYNNLGTLHIAAYKKTRSQNDYNKAVDYYKKTIELDPDYGVAYDALGVAYLEKGFPLDAIKTFRRALDCSPIPDLSYFHIGLAYMQTGDYSNAYTYFQKFRSSAAYGDLPSDLKAKVEAIILRSQPASQIDK
jgi:arylsulfatase A-like enzyme/Flp pilus assembly protein TadD